MSIWDWLDAYELVRGFELKAAQENWIMAGGSPEQYKRLTGCIFVNIGDTRLPKGFAHRIQQMAGPHGYVYCKMILAKGK